MEEPLDKALANLLLKPNTTGAMVVDKNGLCLALKGTASEKSAGERLWREECVSRGLSRA